MPCSMSVAVRGILKYCLRGMLGERQCKTATLFMDAIAALCAPSQDARNMDNILLQAQVDIALAHME